jgi:ATP-binding cassette subfamily B protein
VGSVDWRSRITAVFQDFSPFELTVRRAVGVARPERMDDTAMVSAAVERAGAGAVVAQLPHGLDSQLGAAWPNGTDLSHGQWQRISLARAAVRDDSLLRILDEPASALDAEAEHELFAGYAATMRAGAGSANGAVSVLISHRFSTVAMADLIVVLDGARVAEQGSHAELIARGGRYAQLYRLQAKAYR